MLVALRKGDDPSVGDAVNAGLNAATSPYVCVVDSDSLLEHDALLRIMVPILDDPKRIVDHTVTLGTSAPIDGSVVDEDGKPVAKALVDLRTANREWSENLDTDDAGHWHGQGPWQGDNDGGWNNGRGPGWQPNGGPGPGPIGPNGQPNGGPGPGPFVPNGPGGPGGGPGGWNGGSSPR